MAGSRLDPLFFPAYFVGPAYFVAIGMDVGGSPSRANCWHYIARKRSQSDDAASAIRWARDESVPFLRAKILTGVASGLIDRRSVISAK